jgi:hypothetical protein
LPLNKKFIGFVWNGKEKTVCLPKGKLFDRVLQLKAFLAQDNFFAQRCGGPFLDNLTTYPTYYPSYNATSAVYIGG